ncbi:MAG TPA: D-alanyl-D-alanine carboxypeptidase family protein [Pyrinomonadaceae bacterium]|nr:D-alanyl-D-alanine carboxypeptidase family protein [Pyrinomonadaceae bacterium]
MMRLHFLIFALTCAFVLGGISISARNNRMQATRIKPVKKTVRVTPAPAARSAAVFIEAAATNATLRNELTWTFGGKEQHGWYLYDSLLAQTLDTFDSTTPEFAAALGAWQKKRGIAATGVLDENSLMAMISQWQSNRLKDKTFAQPDQLVTVPGSAFYDPDRAEELRGVERATYDAYKKMIAAAIADPTLDVAATGAGELAPREKYFKIISAFRSRDYQEELRKKSPNAGSAGLAVNSPHFTGRALDIYVGGDPVDTKDANRAIQVKTPAYQWLVRNAERFGFRPYFYEPWHWEYVR